MGVSALRTSRRSIFRPSAAMVTVPSLRRARRCQNRRVSDFGALADEVADAFDLGAPLGPMVEVAGGEQARIWRLDTTAGSFAVKEPRRGFEPRVDGVDVAFQEAVRAQTDVLMPMPVRRPGGAFVVPDRRPAGPRLDAGSTWSRPTPDSTRAWSAGCSPRLHQVDYAPPGRRPRGRRRPLVPRSGRAGGRGLDLASRVEVAGAPFAETHAGRGAAPGRARRRSSRRLVTCGCVTATSGRTTCFGRPPASCASSTGTTAGRPTRATSSPARCSSSASGQPDRMRALYDAYCAAGGPARLERPGQLTMLIAQFGHFWEMAAREWLDPESTDADRAHAEGRVAELMDPPLRVDAVCTLCVGAVRRASSAAASPLDVGGAVVRRPVEQVAEVTLEQRVGLLDRDVSAELAAERGHAGVGDAARDDRVEAVHGVVAVELDAMHRDAAGHPDAERGDLAFRSLLGRPPATRRCGP